MSIHNTHFYHSLIKSYTTVMGSLLDGVDVVRFKPDGTEDSRVTVPVTYSPKEKYIQRLIADPDLLRQPAITLPRIGFEMSGLVYSPDRKLSSKHQFVFMNGSNKTSMVYTPVPYNFMFTATVIAKTQTDMLQIIEQLCPFFTPDITLTMKGINNPNISYDVPISLVGVQKNDSYEGRFEDNRMIIWELQFVLKGFLFGPIRESGVIKHVDLTLYDMSQLPLHPSLRHFIVDIGVEPVLNGVALQNINSADPYGINTTYTYE